MLAIPDKIRGDKTPGLLVFRRRKEELQVWQVQSNRPAFEPVRRDFKSDQPVRAVEGELLHLLAVVKYFKFSSLISEKSNSCFDTPTKAMNVSMIISLNGPIIPSYGMNIVL